MLTLEKIRIYQHFGGDMDGWARASDSEGAAGMADSDWFLIEELRQGLALAATGKASQAFVTLLESHLLETTADDATRQALRALR